MAWMRDPGYAETIQIAEHIRANDRSWNEGGTLAILGRLRLPGRKPAFSWEFKEQRRAPRLPLRVPVRLRIGLEIFDGHSHDICSGGAGVQVVEPQPAWHTTPPPKLNSDDRGALELFLNDSKIAVRVRITRVQRSRGQAHVGLAIDDPREADRLVNLLVDHGYAAGA
jgi:hypothetical protein